LQTNVHDIFRKRTGLFAVYNSIFLTVYIMFPSEDICD